MQFSFQIREEAWGRRCGSAPPYIIFLPPTLSNCAAPVLSPYSRVLAVDVSVWFTFLPPCFEAPPPGDSPLRGAVRGEGPQPRDGATACGR